MQLKSGKSNQLALVYPTKLNIFGLGNCFPFSNQQSIDCKPDTFTIYTKQ